MTHSEIPLRPSCVGTLNPQEAAAFSQPFEHNWGYVKRRELLVGSQDIRLLDPNVQDNPYGVPLGYEQFLPAIALAVEHERQARGSRVVSDALLTVRQWPVAPGRNQQGGPNAQLHRDLDGKTGQGVFYTVSDAYPTQYYPQFASSALTPNIIQRHDIEDLPHVEFAPYDVACASGMVYHRSQPVPKPADGAPAVPITRTFMRLVYMYAP